MRSAFTSLLLTATFGLLAGSGTAVAAVSTTGSLATARTQAAGAAIPGGSGSTASVVVSGGRDTTGAMLAVAERYDPTTGAWTSASALPSVRAGHTAFYVPPTGALTAGRVVVIGGTTELRATEIPATSADSYDPATNLWASGAGGPARADRTYTPIVFRGNPQILATGGQTGTPVTVADVDGYDLVTDTWTAKAAMAVERREHAAVTLPDGRVLVAGGYNANGGILASTELYDPGTNTWARGPTMATPRARFTLSVVDATHVVAIGGVGDAAGTPLASTESYDPTTNAWSPAGSLSVARYDQAATVVRAGWVVVTGGRGAGATALDSAESWTPANGWGGPTALPGSQTLGGARVDHVAAPIPQTSRVLVTGGGVPAAPGPPPVPGTVTNSSILWTPDAPIVPTTPPATTPAPTTPGPSTPDPSPTVAPTPEQGRTVVVGRASGNVFVRIGTTDEYRELTQDEGVPFGTVIDATDGHVRVTAIVGGVLQSAEFWGGTFIVKEAKDGWIEIRLYGKLKCKNGKPVSSKKAVRLVKRKSKPKAWGDGKGKFRTKGKHSSASVRGTRWLVEERCTGTFTKVSRGVVKVRDFPKHRNVTVRAGKNYLAKPKAK